MENIEKVFLVGGTVRDLLVGKEPVDIDLVINGDVGHFARSLASKINGSLFVLDKKRSFFRITCKVDSPPFYYDLSPMRGDNICEDLSLRDFTIDAMAIRPDLDLENIIDPFNGRSDIRNKCIRNVSADVFKQDPLRLLRAFRLAGILNFSIEPETYRNIEEQYSSLRLAAQERIRDEFFRLLSCTDSHKYLIDMHKTGLLGEVIYGLSDEEIVKGLMTLERLEYLFKSLPNFFKPFDIEVSNYLSVNIEDGITNAVVWKWISLYSAIAGEASHQIIGNAAKELRLCKKASKLCTLSSEYRDVSFLDQGVENLKPVYCFFKSPGDNGIGQLLYLIASNDTVLAKDSIIIKNGLTAISWYLTEYKRIKASPLITGDDIRDLFHIPPGPLFRQLLDLLEENRVLGNIIDKKSAINYLKNLLINT